MIMKRMFLLIGYAIIVLPLWAQTKVNDVFSAEILEIGNIQQEVYHNNGMLSNDIEYNITNLFLRYGFNSSVELQLGTTIENYNSELVGTGMGPFLLGGKIYILEYSEGKAGLSLSTGVSIPVFGDHFFKREFDTYLDLAYENRFYDFYKLGINVGKPAGSSDHLDSPYFLINNEIGITEYLDIYVEYKQSFLEDIDNLHYLNLGSWLWVSEDIKLLVQYGKDISSNKSNNILSVGAMIRWLD